MRIVDRATFLALPAGTVFCKFTPMCFGDIEIKTGNVGSNDFCSQDLRQVESNGSDQWLERMIAAEAGASIPLDFDSDCRDGLFDADQLFAVYERADVEGLIARLQAALAGR